MWHFSVLSLVPRCLFISAAQSWPLFLPLCFCPTAHENRRGEKTARSHQLHLNEEEEHEDTHGMMLFYLEMKHKTFYLQCTFLPLVSLCNVGVLPNNFHQIQQHTHVKSSRETAERACWQTLFTKMLTAQAQSHCYRQQEARCWREPVREAGPANRQTSAFVPFPSQQASAGLC